MPRDGSGVYSKAANTTAVPNTVIESAKYNAAIDDFVADANAARPIVAGGTGATSKQGAIDGIFDGTTVIDDSDLRISDPVDRTKIARLDSGFITTATVRVLTAPDADINISGVPRGHLFGLTLSNNATDATNDIDIAVGEAASDATTPWMLTLGSALTKRLDAAWTVGTGNGGLDTGSIANGTYHVWLIGRSDTNVVDALFSASATAPTMPTNYDRKRRIGSIVRASAAILGFIQSGDKFRYPSRPLDVNAGTFGTTAATQALASIPTGISVTALLMVGVGSSSQTALAAITALDETDTVVGSNFGNVGIGATGATATQGDSSVQVTTNTSAQVRVRAFGSGTTINIRTEGYIDYRGRLY